MKSSCLLITMPILLISGCASVTGSTTQNISVQTRAPDLCLFNILMVNSPLIIASMMSPILGVLERALIMIKTLSISEVRNLNAV
jgi:PBP1b-binding outer membrane lipoprotein LpoB